MYAKLTNQIVHGMMSNYIMLGSCMGRTKDRRVAVDELMDLIASRQGEAILFHKRADSRFFIAEFDDVRLMTMYEDRNGDLVVEAIDQLPESAASIIIEMLAKAIQIKTLEWHIAAIDRNQEIYQRGMKAVQNLNSILTGIPPKTT